MSRDVLAIIIDHQESPPFWFHAPLFTCPPIVHSSFLQYKIQVNLNLMVEVTIDTESAIQALPAQVPKQLHLVFGPWSRLTEGPPKGQVSSFLLAFRTEVFFTFFFV